MTPRQPSRTISLIAVLLLAGGAASAQNHEQQQSAPTPQQSTPGQPATPGQPDPATANTDSSATPSFADQAFVEDMLKDNQAQVEMSQLAQQRAFSGDVKEFSQHMIQIHTALNQQLAPLAKQLEVNENQKPSKQVKKEIAQMAQLSGQDFDTAYLQAMAKRQEHNLKALKSEESTRNPTLQKVAKVDEPVLTQHYQILQKIAETHNVTLGQ